MITNATKLIKNDDNRELFLQSWKNSTVNSQGPLLIVHGLGEHSEAYKETAEVFAEDVDVYSFDFSGHGRSSGQRGYVGDINWLIDDLKAVISEINKPLHILAHSLGGLVVTTAIQNDKIPLPKSLILSNPCTGLRVQVPKWKKMGAEFLTKSLPRVTLGNEISPEDLSKDPAYLDEFKKDPLRHTKISPRLYLGMLDLISKLTPENFPISLSTLLLLSKSDPICDPLKTESYFSDLNEKKLHIFEDSMHEILNDFEKKKAHQLIKEFLC